MIDLQAVGKIYPGAASPNPALHEVNLAVGDNEFVAIVGPSGSGKSTLLNIIGCLDVPTSGRCVLFGNDTGRMNDAELSLLRNRSIGFVFQLFNLVPELTVRENVELPLVYAGVVSQRRERTLAVLEEVGLEEKAEQPAGLLSGGEQQRAAIARALVNRPQLILADEPTGSIDMNSGRTVLKILDRLYRDGRTVVIVTHNETVARVALRRVHLQAGAIVADSGAVPAIRGVDAPNTQRASVARMPRVLMPRIVDEPA